MPTRINLSVAGREDPGTSAHVVVQEDYDRVLNCIMPINQPASALEARENLTLHAEEDGARIWLSPSIVAWIEEDRS
jgi:hypothetical protein